MRGDYGSDWKLYASGVASACAMRIVKALEHGGSRVLVCRHTKSLGRVVYESPRGDVCIGPSVTEARAMGVDIS